MPKLNTKPYPYQKEGLWQLEQFGGNALVAWDYGLGKSLLYLMYLVCHPELRPALVVCPAGLKWNWAREAAKHCSMRTEILEGMRPRKWRKLIDVPPLTIINYDILAAWLPYLKRLKIQVVAFDEGHAVCHAESKRSKAAKELAEEIDPVMVLSGSPLANRPADLYHPLHIVRPDMYPNFYPYAMTYCDPKRGRFGQWEFKGATQLPRLHRKLGKECLLRLREIDVLKDLPPKRRIILPLEIEDRKQYNYARREFLRWLAEKYSHEKARRSARAERVTMISYLKQLVSELKLKAVCEWIDDYLQECDEKLIVFGIHRKILEALHEKYHRQSVLVTGAVTGRFRQLSYDKFLTSKKTQLLFGNIKAAGEGWSAMGVPNSATIEFAWVPTAHTQAEGRTRGIGRGKEGMRSKYWYLVGRDTIEVRLVEILQNKQEIIDQVLDGGTTEGNNYDIFDLLTIELQKEQETEEAG
jgi:SWI/SNF-related matrix-associated actin-dependent regulator 1 of chromatin subfamily A